MSSLIERIRQWSSTPHEPRGIEAIRGLSNNLEYVPSSGQYPPHLIAHGQIIIGPQTSDIRTAINIRGNDTELATNVGQVPNTPLGDAVVARLNRRLDGKLVTFDTEQVGIADVVYTTRKPTGWLGPARLHTELEDHAKAQVVVAPILQDTFDYGHVSPQLPYPDVKVVAREIVQTNLNLQGELQSKFAPSQYLPIIQTTSEE